uniref:HAT dimerization domain, ribonuclease H-like domain protein n=1 Tax=Tanacetum cinerariifolium TaxID=118510 RepID=A0A6L2KIL8_TANCI|nr:hAT dimerization domain, ribonuclease H-like domain protein [Tanacetum cinerariifolium]
MVVVINKAPAGYKTPSSKKARTILLDECARNVEKYLAPVKYTWYTQGVSIVCDGWSNVKHKPLINILAVNSRSATFIYAEDFFGVEKTGVEISIFLLEAIESIGPSNVLQVNAANCKDAGEEKKGLYAHPESLIDDVTMDLIDWWSTHGSETPELAEIPKKVLSQPASSSSADRNWSTYSFIHSVKRNRLNPQRADKLVFVHSNIRLISRFPESYKEGPSKKWDMNPETTYLEGSALRMEDMQWENLDED